MHRFLISLGLGLAAALLDVAPMVARKLDKMFIVSAFFMWIALGLIIPAAHLVPIKWLNGVLIAGLCVLPVVLLVTKLDKQAIPAMLLTSVVLGAAIGQLSELLIK